MTKQAALQAFFSQFMTSYPENSTPHSKDVTFPYLTYSGTVGNTGDSVSITVNMWFKTESERVPNKAVDDFANVLTLGGVLLRYDGGAMWIKRGSPFSNSMADDVDPTIKRRVLNLEIEYM